MCLFADLLPDCDCLTCSYKATKVARRTAQTKRLKKITRTIKLTSGTVHAGVESPFAWLRLVVVVVLGTIGSVGMWSVVVALPAVQAEFGVARADASLPYTLSMLGYAFGGVAMGKLSDRYGIVRPMVLGVLIFSLGYVLAGAAATDLWQFALAYGVLIGTGSSVTLGPLMADLSNWFERRRGVAVALVASSNYFAGTLWPPVVQHFIAAAG